MADSSIFIDATSVFDNPAERRVEFQATVDGDVREFGVRYSVIEALTGGMPDAPAAAFGGVSDAIATAALVALARSDDDGTVIVSERDLNQTGSAAPGPHAGPEADAPGADAASPTAEAEAHPS